MLVSMEIFFISDLNNWAFFDWSFLDMTYFPYNSPLKTTNIVHFRLPNCTGRSGKARFGQYSPYSFVTAKLFSQLSQFWKNLFQILSNRNFWVFFLIAQIGSALEYLSNQREKIKIGQYLWGWQLFKCIRPSGFAFRKRRNSRDWLQFPQKLTSSE